MQVRVVADADWIPELDAHIDGEVVRAPELEGAVDADVLVVPMEAAGAVREAHDGSIPAPVVWIVPKHARRRELEALSSATPTSRFIFEPDPHAVASAVRELVRAHAARRREAEREEADRAGASASMEELWRRFQGTMFERLEVLESVGAEILEARVDPDRLGEAHHAVHKLHGSLGTFGLHRGSELAAELEALVEEALELEAMPPGERYRYSELVVALRRQIEAGRPGGTDQPARPEPTEAAGTLLVVEADPDRREKLAAAAVARGWRPATSATAGDALDHFADSDRPDLAILHPGAGDPESLERLLTALAREPDPVPVVFQGRTRQLDERLRAVTLGARVFVDREASVDAVMGRAESLIAEAAPGGARVLVVDDDPAALRVLTFILRGAGFGVRTLTSPLDFWKTLEAVGPDLLILDVEMPDVNGYQLCRAVRADARWQDLPVIFLTGRSRPADVVAGFEAGGDDFVEKPVVGPELLARVEHGLSRLSSTGPVRDRDTGLSSRRVGAERLATQIAIADRYGHVVSVVLIRMEGSDAEALDHAVGRLASTLKGEGRREDVVARWDRHELMVARYDEDPAATHRWLERYLPAGRERAVVGLAAFPEDGDAVEAVLERAAADLGVRRAGLEPGGTDPARGHVDADIVIVDDDEALGTLLERTLDDRGYHTHWIRDGAEAAELLTGEDPTLRASLIILDVGLPGMDGLSLLRRLTRDGITRRSRVLMLTARSAEAEVVKALELGAFDHVPKPFSVSELIHRVRRALGDRGGR